MPTTYFAIPCKRPPAEAERCLSQWRAMGYRLALWRDPSDEPIEADLTIRELYQGYHAAVNALCRLILEADPHAEWIVTGGDDMSPDPMKRADVIAAECTAHFQGTFGVMQPTGDDWARPDLINGSPWMGREFCQRMYGGVGPFCERYPHMWGDSEQYEITSAMGILWQRPDLSHYHHHQAREGGAVPSWMARNNGCYAKYKPLFDARKRAGFPGHEPLTVSA